MANGAKAAPATNPEPPRIRMTLEPTGTALWKIQSTYPWMALRWRVLRTRTALIR